MDNETSQNPRAGEPDEAPDASRVSGDEAPAAGVAVAGGGDDADGFALALADLLPDAAGDVVFEEDLGGPVTLVAPEAPVAQGTAEANAMAAGHDVTGYAFLEFPSGITVYLADDVDVSFTLG